jgi:hypothetical protein
MRPTPGTLLGKKHKMHHREMRLEVGGAGQVDISARVSRLRPDLRVTTSRRGTATGFTGFSHLGGVEP